jgi:Uncharacterized conserved protein (DUF2190)
MAGPRVVHGLVLAYKPESDIPKHRLVKFGVSDTSVTIATDNAATFIGVTTDIDAALGEPQCDVVRSQLAKVVYGAAVTKGDFLGSDAQGRAIPVTTASTNYAGIAEISGVVDDIGSFLVCPGKI